MDLEFEWDEAKAASNLKKHRVSFEAACRVFEDAFAIDQLDSENYGELRFLITGMVNGVLLTVVYSERGPRIRLISARKADRYEQREYYRQQTSE
jgi:uncharacterized DUF497 family protein